MKTTAILACSVFLLASVSLFAQDDEAKETFTYANITEFGLFTTSPKGVAFEATTTHGFAMNKKHLFGLGIGIGVSSYLNYSSYSYSNSPAYVRSYSSHSSFYTPVFLNHRVYFSPHKTFSPHVNTSVGGVLVENGGGIYSALTVGFRAGKFSFSSGLSFMAICRGETWIESINVYDPTNPYYPYSYNEIERKETVWLYPFGITIKCGFSF